jgi:hypothetical protein
MSGKDHLPEPTRIGQLPAGLVCDVLADRNPAGEEFQPFRVVHVIGVEIIDREVRSMGVISGYVFHNRGASFRHRRADCSEYRYFEIEVVQAYRLYEILIRLSWLAKVIIASASASDRAASQTSPMAR